jgi:hypothetical protein
VTVLSFLWIVKKLFEKTSSSKQNTDCGIIFLMGHRKMCYGVETEPSSFPTHAYVASTKRLADSTWFSMKIHLNNPPPVIWQSRNGTTRARASTRMTEVFHSILNHALSFGLHFCYFKRLSVCNKINDGIVFLVDREKIISKVF